MWRNLERMIDRFVTWRIVGRLIARLNHDRRSSLKREGMWHDLICRRIDLISAVDQRSYND